MDIYWLRKTLRIDNDGHPYRSWGQRRLDPVKRYNHALSKGDIDLCLALIDSKALGVNDWLDDGRRFANPDDNKWAWDSRYRPLHKAAAAGHIEFCLALLERGADLGETTLFRQTPLHMAARGQHMPLVALFVELGANLDQPTSSRSTFVDDTVGFTSRSLLQDPDSLDLDAHRPYLAKIKQQKLQAVAQNHRPQDQNPAPRPKPSM